MANIFLPLKALTSQQIQELTNDQHLMEHTETLSVYVPEIDGENKDKEDEKFKKQIHVYVKLLESGAVSTTVVNTNLTETRPDDDQLPKRSSFQMKMLQCERKKPLPKVGEFLKLLDFTNDKCQTFIDITPILLWSNLLAKTIGVSLALIKEKFILNGAPGTGKSCILTLLCFYVAICHKLPVVIFRFSADGKYTATTRLLYNGMFYEWYDKDGKEYKSFYELMLKSGVDPLDCWFCLDGLNNENFRSFGFSFMFRMLAMSGQYSISMEYLKTCVLPYWQESDLKDFAKKHKEKKYLENFDARYFVSGGNLRAFLDDDGQARNNAFQSIQKIDQLSNAAILLSNDVVSLGWQIDHIRMLGVKDRNNFEHYINIKWWTSSITSKFVLGYLTILVEPTFFEKMMSVAELMNDKRLLGVGWEGYFHTLIFRKRTVNVKIITYDNVKRNVNKNYADIMAKNTGTISFGDLSIFEWSGANATQCYYWVPAESLFETIDAIAKVKFPNGEITFCLLQLSRSNTHKCNGDVLWKLAKPYLNKQLKVCYMVLLDDEQKIQTFHLDPVIVCLKNDKGDDCTDQIDFYVGRVLPDAPNNPYNQ
ncbi:crinkler (CRN) family protein [Thraustotheca clavata]|uniref:Crinkler (CRN) family protein n=1 Tax=Thraustotheca clavata TaxID=74557 RepID=A0A1V9YUG0_9STRA|nr:crinkler (CRN) family protein [Thraustotheca clavata]